MKKIEIIHREEESNYLSNDEMAAIRGGKKKKCKTYRGICTSIKCGTWSKDLNPDMGDDTGDYTNS